MSEEQNEVITLEGEDGSSYRCTLLDMFEFEENAYALLLNIDNNNLVVMRLIERDDQTVLQTIESDEEYERVVTYVVEIVSKDET
jgi:hypothetical protein